MDDAQFREARNNLLKDGGQALLALEEQVMGDLLSGLHRFAPQIKADFDLAMDLRVYWEFYAPLQRGRKPRGDAFPWGEVGEKVVEAHLYSMLDQVFTTFRFPGIPYGHDVRFLTDTAFVQIDVKSTGPTDNADELVVSPNQVTGDGQFVDGLVQSTTQKIKGPKAKGKFRPELSPFVFLAGKVYPVLTFYIKVIYEVKSKGNQPLKYLELVCVPNGLLLFDGPCYHRRTKMLFIPGKDDKKNQGGRRVRIRLDPLAGIADWRSVKLVQNQGVWATEARGSGKPVILPVKTT